MKTYQLFKGFKKVAEFTSIMKAKQNATTFGDGTFNLIGDNFRTSWNVLNGQYLG